MKIEVRRELGTEGFTSGTMTVDGVFECFTLEDEVRDGEKVYGETAIPAGVYKVVVSFSQRFQRELPLLLSVPNFEGVRIHPGNTSNDTQGCILVGVTQVPGSVGSSRLAFGVLFPKIHSAWMGHEDIWLKVS